MANSAVTPTAFYTTLGRTDGAAVPAGYVGETFEDTSSTLFTTSQVNIITRTLQPGNWKITAMTSANSGTGTSMTLSISTTSATHDTTYKGFGGLNSINVGSAAAQRYVKISSATTYYIVGSCGGANLTGTQPTMVLWERTS